MQMLVLRQMKTRARYLLNRSNAEVPFVKKHMDAKIFENLLNPVMLVFIGKLSLSTIR